MSEWCPDCQSEEYEILDEETDFELGSVSLSWACKCKQCGCLFVMYRTYNLDPYNSYVEKLK